MPDDFDTNDWAPGQPPPWLNAFGPPPELVPPSQQSEAPVQNSPDFTSRGPGDSPYQTPLSTNDETAFQAWAKQNKAPITDDYDMRGFWQALQAGDPRASTAINQSDQQLHFPDTWKTPLHKTFSNESIYAAGGEPRWIGDVLVAQDGTVVADERSAAAKKASPTPGVAYSVRTEEPPWLSPPPRPGESPLPSAAGTPLTADAISGASQPPEQTESPQQTLARVTLDPDAPLEQRQQAFLGLSPEQRTNIVNNADPTQLASIASAAMSPEDLATIQIRHQQAQIHAQSAAQLELARKADEDAARNYQIYQQGHQIANAQTAQVAADAAALSRQKIDPNEHGIGHFIASVLTSAVGGAMSKYTGGRNLALEELDKKTQMRIEAQQANIANQWKGIGMRQNLIAEQLQRSGDMYRASETYRIATYDRAISELQTKMQDYDPQGTTALRLAGTLQQAQAARATHLENVKQTNLKNYLDLSKQVGESAASQAIYGRQGPAGKTDAEIAKALAEVAKTSAETAKLKAGGAGKPKNLDDIPIPREQIMAMFPGAQIPENIPSLTLKEARMIAATGKGFKEAEKAGEDVKKVQRENSPEELARLHGVGELVDTQGKPIEFRDPAKVAVAKSATDDATRLYDELIDIRRKYGGSSDLIKSPEWRKAHAKFAALLLNQKTRDELGALTGSDIELEAKKIGTTDPTEWRDPLPGLLEGRRNLIQGFNAVLRAETPPGRKPAWFGTEPPAAPTKTPEDVKFQEVLTYTPTTVDQNRLFSELGVQRPMTKSTTQRYEEIASGLAANAGMLPSVKETIDQLSRAARDPKATPEARKDAHAKLSQLASEAEDDAVRNYAAVVRFGGGEEPKEPQR
jgi:hypothetical protein